jgi:hypothetical protein
MNATKLTALAASAAVAVTAFAPAASMAKATGPGKYTVTKQAYVYKEPGKIFDGTVFKGNTEPTLRGVGSSSWSAPLAKSPP